MSSDTVYEAVKAHLLANFTAAPLVFDNEKTDQNGTDPTAAPDPWVLVEMTSDFYGAASIGAGSDVANLYREEGSIWLTVMVQSGSGSLLARQYAKQLVDLFRGVELAVGTIRFRNLAIAIGGQAQQVDGNWYGLPCLASYQADL